MKESSSEKDPPKSQEIIYELTESQKAEIKVLIEREWENVNWVKLNIRKSENLEYFLRALKNYLFQSESSESFKENYLKKGNIEIIAKISEEMKEMFKPKDSKLYFILFKAVFDSYSSDLDQLCIKEYTEKIIFFINTFKNRDEIILDNFADLFEVLIYLKVNQMSDEKMIKLKEDLDKLLKNSLNNKGNKHKLNKAFFTLVNSKIKSQQYVIFDLLLEYIKIISLNISDNYTRNNLDLNLYIFHGILKPIFQLQTNKNLSTNAGECYNEVFNRLGMEKNFEKYYSIEKDLMDDIFKISIEESYPKNNKRDESAWGLFIIFIEQWYHDICKENKKEEHEISIFSSARKENKKRPSISIKHYKDKLDSIYIPYYLFNEVISLIIKLYEYENIEVKKEDLEKIKTIIRMGESDILKTELKKKVFEALKNKKIKNKENLTIWLEFLLDIYSNENQQNFREFVIEYINYIPIDDINVFITFEELLLMKGFKTYHYKAPEYILERLIDKIINSGDIIYNNQIYKSIQKTLSNCHKHWSTFEIFVKAFKFITKDGIIQIEENIEIKKDEKKEKNKNDDKEKIDNKNKNILIFAEKMVYKLTELLENNLSSFRESFTKDKKFEKLFQKLYSIWAIEPLSVLILCIATEKFELAFNIILNLKNIEFNDDIFGRLAKVVENFEKDDYKFFCDKLLSPSKNIFFIKTLFGILMILPQGVAFDFLNEKLSNVQTLLLVENDIDVITNKINENNNEIDKKIKIFLKYQQNKKFYGIDEKEI